MPIKAVATELDLLLHQIDSFRSWNRDWLSHRPYNLVVAVSFGLLVPAAVLEKAKYGGLNVHPSLLPDLRGSAPITHALLKRRPVTGVSLQTMHPTKFDHGVVLAQSEEVPLSSDSTPEGLIQQLGPLGADLLRKSIEEGVFVPPVQNAREGMPDSPQIELAPKITSKDRQIDWSTWTADDIILRSRVLGDLWDIEIFERCQASSSSAEAPKRLTFNGGWVKIVGHAEKAIAGQPQLVLGPFRRGLSLGIQTVDNCVIVPESVTIEGRKKGKGLQSLNEQLRMQGKARS